MQQITKRKRRYKMILTIETQNSPISGDIENAFDLAMNTTNISDFIAVLIEELPAYEVIQAGSHIAIHIDNTRVAIIA